MRIGEAAKQTGLNISSVRFYERKGLLHPEREGEGQYREYTEEDVQRIREILLYRKMGLSVESISLLLKQQADRRELINENITNLQEQMDNLKTSIELSRRVLQEENLDPEKIEQYLAYVCQEEEQGHPFVVMEELLDEVDAFTKDSLPFFRSWTLSLLRWPWVSRLLSVLFWMLILSIPVLHLAEVCMGKDELSILRLIFYGLILFVYAKGFLHFHKLWGKYKRGEEI